MVGSSTPLEQSRKPSSRVQFARCTQKVSLGAWMPGERTVHREPTPHWMQHQNSEHTVPVAQQVLRFKLNVFTIVSLRPQLARRGAVGDWF